MAVDSNALSLATWAKMSNDPLIQKITFSLYEHGSILQDVPLMNRKTTKVAGTRWEGNLPTINWSKVNAAPVVTNGTPVQYQEGAFIIRNFLDVDHVLRDDVNNVTDPVASQIEAYMYALAYDVNDKLFNNNHVTGNSDAIVGLRYRLDNYGSYGIPQEMKIDGQGVNLVPGTMSQATAIQFFELIDQLLQQMKAPDGTGVTLYMGDVMHRRFSSAAKIAGNGAGLDNTKDEYDRTIYTYKNAKLRYAGRKSDQTTEIITATETAAGANGISTDDYTSIYGVRWGENYAAGWQWETMKAKTFGQTDDAVIDRTLLEYIFGLYFNDNRSIGRIYDIKLS